MQRDRKVTLKSSGAALAKNAPELPLSLQLILLTVFVPEQLSFFIGGLRLTATRLLLIILTPIVFIRLFKQIGSRRYSFVMSDLFVSLASLWMFIGPAVTSGPDSILHSGPIVLEFLIAYMSTRFLLSKEEHSLAFINLLCLVTAIVALDGLLDVVTGEFFTREFFSNLTGYRADFNAPGPDSFRFGLRRAAGPLEHCILFGFVSAIGLVYALSVKIRRRNFSIFACGLGVLISGSAAPMQVAALGGGLLIYSRVLNKIKLKWAVVWAGLAIVVAVLFTLTDTPIGHLIDLMTIDPGTAYYRLYIWRSVGPAILQNPYFSVLENAYEYRGSIDSVWLYQSLEYGMPCAIFTALSMIGSCSLPTRSPNTNLTEAEKSIAQTTSILILLSIFMGLTVHFWGSAWILVSLLVGLRANLGAAGRLPALKQIELPSVARSSIANTQSLSTSSVTTI